LAESLILFDIDGTLLSTGGAGIAALTQAFGVAFPEQAARMPELDLAGATDSGLVINIFRHAEIEHTEANRDLFYDTYLEHLAASLPEFGGTLLPGVVDLLTALAEHQGATIGLLTGNLERGARMKVEHFGIGEHFSFGSYGDDHHDRDLLGPIAIRRANDATGKTFSAEQTYVIGDTPKDIRCARAAGARAIAVATGGISRSDLESHSPDALFDELADTPTVLRSLGIPA